MECVPFLDVPGCLKLSMSPPLSPLMQGVQPALTHALKHLASHDVIMIPSKVTLYGQLMQV